MALPYRCQLLGSVSDARLRGGLSIRREPGCFSVGVEPEQSIIASLDGATRDLMCRLHYRQLDGYRRGIAGIEEVGIDSGFDLEVGAMIDREPLCAGLMQALGPVLPAQLDGE
jgi:hypothetical protein